MGFGAHRPPLELSLSSLCLILGDASHPPRDPVHSVHISTGLQAALSGSSPVSIPAGRVPHYRRQALKDGIWEDIRLCECFSLD